MILTLTDTIQTTWGPIGPKLLPEDNSYIYGYNTECKDMDNHDFEFVDSPQYVHSAMLLEVSAKKPDGSNVHAVVPWDVYVLLADGDCLPAHELTKGTKIAYFTRVMRHEKYSAMRVVPFMTDRHLEHRWVWEAHSGMEVPPTHNVDHIDGNSYNNRYNNLRALDIRSHSKMTAHRQRNRHTRRNADGSFAKGSTTERIASANQPIPDYLSTGTLNNTCKVVSMEEIVLDAHYFNIDISMDTHSYIVYGNILVQPGD